MIPNQNQNAELIINGNNVDVKELSNILTQDKAHPSLSNRYSLVKTMDVLNVFENAGFTWKIISQEKCRGHYAGYGTHLVAVEHPEIAFKDTSLNSEIKPRLYLKNSYHGRSRLMLDLGIFRAYCQNGLFVGTMLESFRRRHVGIDPEDMAQVVMDMKKAFEETVTPLIGNLMQIEMGEENQLEFAKTALAQRMSTHESFLGGEHEKLLIANRDEDKGNSAWKVLNRVQENLGLNFRSSPIDVMYRYEAKDKDGNNQIKERKLSKLGRIDEVSRMNKVLFDTIAENIPTNEIQLIMAA